jgi:hypothetical protein
MERVPPSAVILSLAHSAIVRISNWSAFLKPNLMASLHAHAHVPTMKENMYGGIFDRQGTAS